MPLTFPSHAAAVLPLLHIVGTRQLPASALVFGSAAPDLVYLIGTLGADAHHPAGLLSVCLPAGIAAFLYVEGLVLPVLGPLLVAICPARMRPTMRRLVAPRPLPATTERWVMVSIAVILGAATHLLWDGFTHAWLWPASALYPDSTLALFGEPVLISRVLQHTSSVIGLAIVLAYLYRTAPPASDLDGLARRHATRRLLTILAVPIVGGVIAAGIKFQAHDPLITRLLWNAAWSAAAWFALLLGAVCLVERLRGRDS